MQEIISKAIINFEHLKCKYVKRQVVDYEPRVRYRTAGLKSYLRKTVSRIIGKMFIQKLIN